MKRRLGLLTAGSLALWLAVSYPARLLGGESAVVYSAVAVALCLAPTLATLAWAGWALDQSPEQQLLMLLGGTGVRMGVVLGAGLALYTFVPYFQESGFWVWLLVFYLFTLALEMALLVAGRAAAGDPYNNEGSSTG
jgi:hypothetical protein